MQLWRLQAIDFLQIAAISGVKYVTCSIAHSCILPPRKTKWRHEGTFLQAEQSESGTIWNASHYSTIFVSKREGISDLPLLEMMHSFLMLTLRSLTSSFHCHNLHVTVCLFEFNPITWPLLPSKCQGQCRSQKIWSFSALLFSLCTFWPVPMPATVQPPNLKGWNTTHGGTWEWLEKQLIPRTQLILT